MKVMTGVGAVLCAAHRDKETGRLHGHTWEITAWFPAGRSAIELAEEVAAVVAILDHSELPDELAWGEEIASWVALALNERGANPAQVDVSRQAERIYARWLA